MAAPQDRRDPVGGRAFLRQEALEQRATLR
jgi:hypothetical protein